MRVFLSHAGADAPTAQYLKTCFGRVLGVDIFMMPDDAPPGSKWIEQIRAGIESCDELFSLASPDSVKRPWLSAEWACFWLQSKPCTPLLVDVTVADLWQPMQAYQAADLLEPTVSLPLLLRRLAGITGKQPPEGVSPLAHSIAEEIPRVRERQRQISIEQVLERLGSRMADGTDNIEVADVALMVEQERVPELLELVETGKASAVKRRQVAVALVSEGRLGEALRIARGISNRAEARTIAVRVVQSMDRGAGQESEGWIFLAGVYDHLRPPQRRDVRDEMRRMKIAPLGPWDEDQDSSIPAP